MVASGLPQAMGTNVEAPLQQTEDAVLVPLIAVQGGKVDWAVYYLFFVKFSREQEMP